MNKRLQDLFDRLNKCWGKTSKSELHSEVQDCSSIQQEILEEIRFMRSSDVVQLINDLTDSQINQIITIIEDIINFHPQVIHSLKSINRERNIYCLNYELKMLNLL